MTARASLAQGPGAELLLVTGHCHAIASAIDGVESQIGIAGAMDDPTIGRVTFLHGTE